ncbi:MAG: hypothetical protein BWK80_27790 [Desulfobacteraceae bacterium IS3]|nr:MAG: hypothetical protein BWK80_27790 [Desulfobacteraceae bacterium IS3]
MKFEQAGSSFRLRAKLEIINGSELYIRETVIDGIKLKYSYHWQSSNNEIIIRWDNSPDWEVETFPHHKHIGQKDVIESSYERTLEQVLNVIAKQLRKHCKI